MTANRSTDTEKVSTTRALLELGGFVILFVVFVVFALWRYPQLQHKARKGILEGTLEKTHSAQQTHYQKQGFFTTNKDSLELELREGLQLQLQTQKQGYRATVADNDFKGTCMLEAPGVDTFDITCQLPGPATPF